MITVQKSKPLKNKKMNTTQHPLFKESNKGATKKNNPTVIENHSMVGAAEKTFTTADFWKIQRGCKTMLQRRRFA
jgi:hypothetical protein